MPRSLELAEAKPGRLLAIVTKPNFVIAGAARSGTTALAKFLEQHPDVFITDPKEVHFLAFANQRPVFTGPGDDVMLARRLVSDPLEYAALYDRGAGRAARGEGSVSTLYHPASSIASIREFAAQDTKVICILREPAARAYSAYLYLRGRGYETAASFEEALQREDSRKVEGYSHLWQLRGMSRYSEQLPSFVREFGDQLMVLVLEEFAQDRESALANICRFLGIDDSFRFEAGSQINRGGVQRSALLGTVLERVGSVELFRSAVLKTTSHALRERVRRANLERPQASAETMAMLHEEFALDRQCVEDALGRSIPSWELG